MDLNVGYILWDCINIFLPSFLLEMILCDVWSTFAVDPYGVEKVRSVTITMDMLISVISGALIYA